MRVLPRELTAAVVVSVIACARDPFVPLFDACADEMAQVRESYPGAPTGTRQLTLSDGSRVVIWELPVQPGPGLSPTSMAFIWSAEAPQSCQVCVPGSPGCVPASTATREI